MLWPNLLYGYFTTGEPILKSLAHLISTHILCHFLNLMLLHAYYTYVRYVNETLRTYSKIHKES